jgi:tetratricopeptide (TPR) repeat protein
VLAGKFFWLTQRTEIRDSHSFHFFAAQSTLLSLLPAFGLVFPLSVAGIVAAVRARQLPPVLAGYVLLMGLTCLILVVGLRYRLPLTPMLAILGGYAAVSAWEASAARQWRRLALPGAACLAAALLTFARPHAASLNLAEEYALTGAALIEQHDLDRAEPAYRLAIDAAPTRAIGWNGLGVVELNRGNLTAAEADFRRAVQLDPSYAAPHEHLGVVFARRGEFDKAIPEFRTAVGLRPDDPGAVSGLADALMAAGQPGEALQYYELIRRHQARPDPLLLVAMARAEGERGRPDAARRLAGEAIALDPAHGEAWYIASLADLTMGNTADAEKALDRATSLLGDRVDLALARASLLQAQGRAVDAEALLRRLLAKAPGSPAVRGLYLQVAEQNQHLEEARRFLAALDRKKR